MKPDPFNHHLSLQTLVLFSPAASDHSHNSVNAMSAEIRDHDGIGRKASPPWDRLRELDLTLGARRTTIITSPRRSECAPWHVCHGPEVTRPHACLLFWPRHHPGRDNLRASPRQHPSSSPRPTAHKIPPMTREQFSTMPSDGSIDVGTMALVPAAQLLPQHSQRHLLYCLQN